RDRALVAHPGDRAGGVETSREGDADAFADGEGAQHLGHEGQAYGRSRDAGAAHRQPSAGAMSLTIDSRIRALNSTPSWLGTVTRIVWAACTAASCASSAAMTSGAPI